MWAPTRTPRKNRACTAERIFALQPFHYQPQTSSFASVETHNISHHLMKYCNFLHDIMSVIQWCHQLGTFFDKIVSICVQYQGYLDPDIIGLFCHDYIICTTQTRRYTADPSYHYKYISFGVHMIRTYHYQSMRIGKEIVDIIHSTFEHIHT